MKEPIKIVMLPTKDKTLVVRNTYCFTKAHGNPLRYVPNLIDSKEERNSLEVRGFEFQHLYITVSHDVEPIKEGDWCLWKGKIIQASKMHCIVASKVIATTDPKLLPVIDESDNMKTDNRYVGLPQVQQSFLKEFVANPDGEWEVEYEESTCKCLSCNSSIKSTCEYSYRCNIQIIKKLKLNQDNTVNITAVKERGITITSVEEKMYSKDEVKVLMTLSRDRGARHQDILWNDWIEENL